MVRLRIIIRLNDGAYSVYLLVNVYTLLGQYSIEFLLRLIVMYGFCHFIIYIIFSVQVIIIMKV